MKQNARLGAHLYAMKAGAAATNQYLLIFKRYGLTVTHSQHTKRWCYLDVHLFTLTAGAARAHHCTLTWSGSVKKNTPRSE